MRKVVCWFGVALLPVYYKCITVLQVLLVPFRSYFLFCFRNFETSSGKSSFDSRNLSQSIFESQVLGFPLGQFRGNTFLTLVMLTPD